MNNLIEKQTKDLNRYLTKEDIQITNKYMKDALHYISFKNYKIKRYHYVTIRVAKPWNIENTSEDVEPTDFIFIAGGNAKMAQPLWEMIWQFLTMLSKSFIVWSSNCSPWYLPKWVKHLHSHKNLHVKIYSNFIHNCQNLETTKCLSTSKWIIILWYIIQWILSNDKMYELWSNRRYEGILNIFC